MNILIQTNSSPFQTKQRFGGAETSLKLIAEKLAENGHYVVFIAKADKYSAFGFSKKYINGVNLIVLKKTFLSFFRKYKLKKVERLYHKLLLKKIIRKNKIDIVYTYYNINICNFYLKYKENSHFKLVVRIAGLKWYEDVISNKRKLNEYKYIFENSDLLNFISEGLYKNFLELNKINNYGIKLSNYFIGDIGVKVSPLKLFATKQNQEEFKLVMATRFSHYQKRQDILVKAIHQIDTDKIPYKLYLIGEGPNKKNIELLIEKYKLTKTIKVLPFMEQEELFKFINDCDLLCHSCDYEGLSKIIVETMYLGVPVLASNVFPLNDYILDGVNGYLVENEPDKWAKKIEYLYAKQSEFSTISKNAINYIEDNYNANKNIKLYIEEFKKISNQNGNKRLPNYKDIKQYNY